jgi:ATP-dependent RNA circularization protein (DNA/RNA ligase family)
MDPFLKFPHTPHLVWLGGSPLRGDKVLSPVEADAFLAGEVIVEEKVDGTNLGLSIDDQGNLRVQCRGSYLIRKGQPQLATLWPWLSERRDALVETLSPHLILFGEWCYAQHTVHYDNLPDWFLAFDVYDGRTGEFWCKHERDALAVSLGIEAVPALAEGIFARTELLSLLGDSHLGSVPMEGIYLRKEDGRRLISRAKIVGPEFAQSIGEHWTGRPLRRNAVRRFASSTTGQLQHARS